MLAPAIRGRETSPRGTAAVRPLADDAGQTGMVTEAIRPHRLLLVTFDLTGTTPGDRRYAQAEAALAAHGPVFRPVKQLRFVITRSTSRRVKASLDQRLGRSSTILVTPIKSIPAWRIVGLTQRRQWRAFVRALEEHGIRVDYVRSDADGPG